MGGKQSSESPSQMLSQKSAATFDYEDVIDKVPYDIHLVILSHVPAQDLMMNCARVCKHWRDMVNHPTLWHMKCVRAGRKVPSNISPEDFQRIYIKNPYGRNLVRNPCAKEMFQHWNVEYQGGDNFAVEDSPSAHSDNFRTFLENEEEDLDARVWATSYGWCCKHQIVDLMKEGCSSYVLDQVRPPILVKELYSSRLDCGCQYDFKASLCNNKMEELKEFEFRTQFRQWENQAWNQVEHTFTDYDPGVRYVKVWHRGKDTQFWAGHYGSKFTMTTVRILLS